MSVTLTVSDGIAYFDKIMPILPLLSTARLSKVETRTGQTDTHRQTRPSDLSAAFAGGN